MRVVNPEDYDRSVEEWERNLESGVGLEETSGPPHRRDSGALLEPFRATRRALGRAHEWLDTLTGHERDLSGDLSEDEHYGEHMGHWEWDLARGRIALSDELRYIYGLSRRSRRITFAAFLDLVHPADRDETRRVFVHARKTGGSFVVEHRIVRSDGLVRTVKQRGHVVRNDRGDPACIVGSGQDITERKRFERMHEEFISMAAHELKTPITALKGYAQLLARGRHVEEAAMAIVDQSNHLTALVEDLLEASRLEMAPLELRLSEVDYQELLERCVAEAQSQTEDHRIHLRSSGELPIGRGDTGRLEQVVHNLLSNALKYTPDGGQIEVGVQRVDDDVEICVQDQGIGIAEENLGRIFDRFYHAEEDAGASKGLGLGLYIVRAFVEAHGGVIFAESGGPGQGATFRARIPLQPPQTPAPASMSHSAAAPESQRQPGREGQLRVSPGSGQPA